MNLNLVLGIGAQRVVGLTPMPFPEVTTEPTVRIHARQSPATESGGKVTAIDSLTGVGDATNGTSDGPSIVTYNNGWKALRFDDGAAFLTGATDFSASPQGITVVMVARIHRSQSMPLFSMGASATANPMVRLLKSGQSAAFLCSARSGIPTYDDNREYMFPGSELQVIAVRSDTTAVRTLVDNFAANSTANTQTGTFTGYEIGRNSTTPGSSGTWGAFDLLDLLVYDTGLSDSAVDAVVADLVTGYSITAKTNRMITEGNSITNGFRSSSGRSPSMCMTDPGDTISVPAGWNVLNIGVSGNRIDDMVTRRDDTNTVFAEKLPGRNIISLHAGTNNIDSPSLESAATTYGKLVPLLNTTTTGYLQRGWEVFVDKIIAYNNASTQAVIETYRGLVDNPTFLTDTLSNTGQTYEGKVTVVDVAGFEYGGGTLFDTLANAGGTNTAGLDLYFDNVHPNDLGSFFFAAAKTGTIFNTAITTVPGVTPTPPPPPPPPASPGYLGSTVTAAGSGTSVNANVPAEAISGEALVAFGFTGTGAEYSAPSGWTSRLSSSGATVFTMDSWDGTTSSYTFTAPSSTAQTLIMAAYKDYAFDAIGTLSSATTNPTPPNVTATADDCINITFVGAAGAGREYSMPSGWTQRAETITGGRSAAMFERDATVNTGTITGEVVSLIAGTGNSRAVQLTMKPA